MIQPTDTHTLSEFQQNAPQLIDALQRSGRPKFLTVEGETAAVILDPATYERFAGQIERAEIAEAVREGLADYDAGRHEDADVVIRSLKDELRREGTK